MAKRRQVQAECGHVECGLAFLASVSRVNHAAKIGAPLYCGRACAGLARRTPPKSDDERRSAKAEYDKAYREKNREKLKDGKAEYHRRTFSPERGREQRARSKAAGHDHSAYCREYMERPGKKAEKQDYDRERRARVRYGEFAEVFLLALDLQTEVRKRISWYDAKVEQGYFARVSQKRRDRQRERATT